MPDSAIFCPLCLKNNAMRVGSLAAAEIVESFRANFAIDTSPYFAGIETVHICECRLTGYRYFTPLNLGANAQLYEELGTRPWYYESNKWEFSTVDQYVQTGTRVLEVGCGNGALYKAISATKDIDYTGLELTAHNGTEVRIIQETIEEHAEREIRYDAVCAFQVLEHVADVHSFLTACIGCLAANAPLIIGVPNNAGYVGLSQNALNMPPHHMGLWKKYSLERLPKVFPEIRHVATLFDPTTHPGLSDAPVIEHFYRKWLIPKAMTFKFLHAFILPRWVRSKTVVAVFRKREPK